MNNKLLIPIIILTMTSCDSFFSKTQVSTSINENCIVSIYQVYEEVYGSNVWANPRFDYSLTCNLNDKISIEEIRKKASPRYQCYGDGYYWYVGFYFDEALTDKIDNYFIVKDNINIYYGCQG